MELNFLREPGTADLDQEFRDQVAAFMLGSIGLEDLQLWMADFAPELGRTGNSETKALNGRLWRMLGEYGRGDRTPDSIREDLAPTVGAISSATVRLSASGEPKAFIAALGSQTVTGAQGYGGLIHSVWIPGPNLFWDADVTRQPKVIEKSSTVATSHQAPARV